LTNLYDEVVEALHKVFEVIPEGVELSKGGLGELALAHHLGHTLVEGDKGADAMDADGLLYEYKVSTTDQYNFSAGGRSGDWEKDKETIEKHFYDIEGTWIASREGMHITDCTYVSSEVLVPVLVEHFEKTNGRILNKNFRMKAFKELSNV